MARLEIIVDSGKAKRNVDDLTESLRRNENAGNRVGNVTQTVTVNIREAGNAASAASTGMNKLAAAAAAVTAGFGVAAIFKASEEYVNLNNKLKLVTNSQFELKTAFNDVFAIAQSTASALSSTAVIYQNFAKNADVLGLSQKNIAGITKTVSQAVAISGGTAESASAALMQFGQSLASGVFRGEEFNSVAEQAPGLLRAIASGLGLTSGELRKMANEGKLTADVVTGALQKSADSVQADFNKMALTVTQAITQINNAKIKFIGSETSEASAVLAKSLSSLARNFDDVAKVAEVVVAGTATFYFAKVAIAVKTATTATVANIATQRAAQAATLASTTATATATSATAQYAAMQLAQARATVASTSGIARLTAVQTLLLPAQAANTAALAADTAAQAANTAAKNAAVTVTSILRGALFGPVGLALAVAAVAAGFLFMGDKAKEASPKLSELGSTAEEVEKKFATLNRTQREGFLSGLNKQITEEGAKTKTLISDLYKEMDDIAKPTFGKTNLPLASLAAAVFRSDGSAEAIKQATIQINAMESISQAEKDRINIAAQAVAQSRLDTTDLLQQREVIQKSNKQMIAGFDLMSEAQQNAHLKEVARIEKMKVADKGALQTAEENAKKLADINDPTERGRAIRQIADDEKKGIFISLDVQKKVIASADAIDKAQKAVKDSKKSMNAETKEENALLRESNAELTRQKNAYLSLAESQLDPIEAINKKYRQQIDLINKAASGRFKATGAAAISGDNGIARFKTKSFGEVNFDTTQGVKFEDVVKNEKLTPEQKKEMLSEYQNYLADKNALFQKSVSAGIDISTAERDARIAMSEMEKSAAINMYNAQYTQQLASLSDYAKSAQDILDEKLEADKLKNENSYITDVNGAQKRADMLLAIEIKHAKDSARIRAQQVIDQQSIFQPVKDAIANQAQAQSNVGLGSAEAGLSDQVFAISQRRDQAIRDSENKARLERTDLAAEESIARIENLKAAAQQEIDLAKNNQLTLKAINDQKMQQAAGFFGDFAALSQSKNRELAAIGKAAAITQATINGFLAVSNALAVQPYPLGVVLAVGAGVAAAVNVANIAGVGFSEGGYTGSGRKNDPAGIVHKGEVVWSQSDIRRAGGVDAVESMRRGMQTSYMQDVAPQRMQSSNQTPQAQNPVINIHNHGIDEAIEDWFKGSSSDKHFVNKFERNKSSMRMA